MIKYINSGLAVVTALTLSTPTLRAAEWENIRLIQVAQASTQSDDDGQVTWFQAGQPCQNLSDFRGSDIRRLADPKFKWLRDTFCQLDDIETCDDYGSYLPSGFKLKPAGQGTMCKLVITSGE